MKYLAILAISLLPISVGAAQDPETVFNQSCGICHNGQLHTAPKKEIKVLGRLASTKEWISSSSESLLDTA